MRAAFASLGLATPPERIIANLAPADLPKEGMHFDLGLARARDRGQSGAALNSEVSGAALDEIAAPDEAGVALLAKAAAQLGLSARAYHRTLRVARTIADLEGGGGVRRVHIAEALGFRRIWAGAANDAAARVS